MRLEPKPALQATLYLVGLIVLLVVIGFVLPWWALTTVGLAIMLGCLWWMLYELHRLKKPS
jgi:hypothetical protein